MTVGEKTAVVTGAGSGVGRAVALKLMARGWRVALVGRRWERLERTLRLADEAAASSLASPCDIGDDRAVARLAEAVLSAFGHIEVLVNAAGTNLPERSLAELTPAAYRRLMDTNLNGAYACTQAFLPGMRARGAGTIVNVVSDAGKAANAKAGAAYVISKFGLAGLTQAINAEEREGGIRACAVFPGEIATPLLELRPEPPPEEARERMLQPDDVAACVLLAITLPERAVVEEIVVRPRRL